MNRSSLLIKLSTLALFTLTLSACGGNDGTPELSQAVSIPAAYTGTWVSECIYVPGSDFYAVDEQTIRGNQTSGTVFIYESNSNCLGEVDGVFNYSGQLSYDGTTQLDNGIEVDVINLTSDGQGAAPAGNETMMLLEITSNGFTEYLDNTGNLFVNYTFDQI